MKRGGRRSWPANKQAWSTPQHSTIIHRDSSSQTDFNENFANLTLLEYPCPFYSNGNVDTSLGWSTVRHGNPCHSKQLYNNDDEHDAESDGETLIDTSIDSKKKQKKKARKKKKKKKEKGGGLAADTHVTFVSQATLEKYKKESQDDNVEGGYVGTIDDEQEYPSLGALITKQLRISPKEQPPHASFIKKTSTPVKQQPQQQQQQEVKKSKQKLEYDLLAAVISKERKNDVVIENRYQLRKEASQQTEETRKGKERESGKKKHSTLKKVILREREEKRKSREQVQKDSTDSPQQNNITELSQVDTPRADDITDNDATHVPEAVAVSEHPTEWPTSNCAELTQDDENSSPMLSQQPSIATTSAGDQSADLRSDQSGRPAAPDVVRQLHSRRFREYCDQMLNKDIDDECTLFLAELVKFQDRLYHKNPLKAKARRRIVLGLREVTKHVKLNKVKVVIVSPNMEKIRSAGGLDDTLQRLMTLARSHNVPVVFALSRRALGRVCRKPVAVSVVGVFNYSGAEEHFARLMALSAQARQAYEDLVETTRRDHEEPGTVVEVVEVGGAAPHPVAPGGAPGGGPGGGPGVPRGAPPHLHHSRQPSDLSTISLTSSVFSDYPLHPGERHATRVETWLANHPSHHTGFR